MSKTTETGELTEQEKIEEIEDFIEDSIEENNHEKDVNKKLTLCAVLLIILVIILALFGSIFAPSSQDIIGNGSKSITLTVVLPHETVNYKIATDAFYLDEVLMENSLANINHMGSGSPITEISGYTLKKNVDWYDIYINEQIIYLQTSNINIQNGENYKIVII